MGYGKWIGGIMGFMTMGPLGALAGFAIGSLFDKSVTAQEEMDGGYGSTAQEDVYTGQRNSFCSPCWSWLRISFVPTDASCTAKWSLCVSSCA